jgi:tetratricopeptide (TPR) repeat protein
LNVPVIAASGDAEIERANTLNSKVVELYQAGKYEEAIAIAKQVWEIREKVFGSQHPDTATSLNNLAALYDKTGRYAEAEPLYKRALEIKEKALGGQHPVTATSLNNLASLYAAIGRHDEGHYHFNKARDIEESVKENVFQLLSDKEKLTFVEQNSYSINAFINHTASYMKDNPQALTDTLNAWLRWKGTVMEAQGRYL